MKYFLIDNCTLRDLIDKHGYSRDLQIIEDLISESKFGLLTHKLIIEEWEKHKAKWLKEKERKLLKNKITENIEQVPVPFENIISTDHLLIQVSQIDKILSNAKETLTTPQVIEQEFSNRFREKLAPFHNKRNSQNDWEIFGSFCLYCQMHGIHELYFISANFTDFGNPEDSFKTIHRDLKERFPQVKIHYFKNYKDFLEEATRVKGISFELIKSTIAPNDKYSYKTTVRKTVLESLLYIYNDLYAELNFIPVHILKRYYPFSSSEYSYCYYSNFTLSNVSEKLVSFFSKVKVNDEKEIEISDEILFHEIKDYKEKIKLVLNRLSQNLIFHISGEKSNKRVCTHFHETSNCTCVRCSFQKFLLINSLKELQIETTDFQDALKKAYYHSQVGNFKSAALIYSRIEERALTQKKYITYFIAKYNQKHLSNFLKNIFSNETIDNELVNRLSLIDMLEEAVKLKEHSDYKFLSYTAKEDFFSDAFQEITASTNKIISHYYSQLRGGWSSNSYIWELIGAFTNLESFLTNNYIIYDTYSNFSKLFETVAEGIFASYSISTEQGDRFEKFDNYWVYRFIFYGNKASIIKLLNRYKIEMIPYDPNDTYNESLAELAKNFFESMRVLKCSQNDYIEPGNKYFEQKCNEWFDNILTVSSFLDISTAELETITELILNHLELEPNIPYESLAAVEYFISKKGKLLNEAAKYQFLSWGIKNKHCFRDTLLTILEIFNDNTIINISEHEFNSILNKCLHSCNHCGRRHETLLGTFFEKVSKAHRELIYQECKKEIQKGTDFDLYYIMWMYDIVPLDKTNLINFISEYNISGNKNTPSFWGRPTFQITRLDKIINVCFKFNINFDDPIFDAIRQTHLYYSWLLDPENFDYTHFDVNWVLIYQTAHYLKVMAKSENLKKALRNSLTNKSNPAVEKYLLRITYFITE